MEYVMIVLMDTHVNVNLVTLVKIVNPKRMNVILIHVLMVPLAWISRTIFDVIVLLAGKAKLAMQMSTNVLLILAKTMERVTICPTTIHAHA